MTEKTQRLTNALDSFNQSSLKRRRVYGILGRVEADGSLTVRVPSDPNKAHVRVQGQQAVTTAFHRGTVNLDSGGGQPVIMWREDGHLHIEGYNPTQANEMLTSVVYARSGADGPVPGIFDKFTSDTDGNRTVLYLAHITDQDMVDYFGASIQLAIEDGAGVRHPVGFISAQRDGADNSGRLVFSPMQGGVVGPSMIVWSDGTVQMQGYGAGVATFDANGVLTSVPGGGGGANTLDDLTDVDVSAPTDDYVLTYDSGSGLWMPQATASVNVGQAIASSTVKPTPVDADLLGMSDSADGGLLKHLSMANLRTFLQTTFSSLYAAIGHDHAGVYSLTSHDHAGVYSLTSHDHAGVYALLAHDHAAGDVSSGTFDDGRIAQSNVTQHQAAIDHGSIAGLADDDHTGYALLAGRSGGNAFTGDLIATGSVQGSINRVHHGGLPRYIFGDENGTMQWLLGARGLSNYNFYFAALPASNSGTDLVNAAKMTLTQDGRMAVGNSTPPTSARLDIQGTTGALLLPRLTTAQRNALTPANGFMIYNTTDNRFQGYSGGTWLNIT